MYLERMRLSTSTILHGQHGLWGDTFCIRWVSKWLKIAIAIWSTTTKQKYLHFNNNITKHTYSILFHDKNPIGGHYKPIISKKYTYLTIIHHQFTSQTFVLFYKVIGNKLHLKCEFKVS